MPRMSNTTDREDHENGGDTPELEVQQAEQRENDGVEEEVSEDPGARNPWKVKGIRVSFESRDQGWTSEHYEGDGTSLN